MVAGISLKTVPHALIAGTPLATILVQLHPQDGWPLLELLTESRKSLSYTNITIKREMPAISEVLLRANDASLGVLHFGLWCEGLLCGYLFLHWDVSIIDPVNDIPEIELVVSDAGAEYGQDDVLLELGIQLCRDYGFINVQASVNLVNPKAQHCFFRHGFRPLVFNDPEPDSQAIMIYSVKDARDELTFPRYSKDVARLKKAMETKYGQEFPDAFISDFAAFVNTYVVGAGVR